LRHKGKRHKGAKAQKELNKLTIASFSLIFLFSVLSVVNSVFKEERIMVWKCTNCGYTFDGETYPERCPSCKEACEFVNVTCYIPDCGGPGQGTMDDRLGKKEKEK